MKVLFHINDPERWQRTLVNVSNFINDIQPDFAEIEVLANGAAVLSYYGEGIACEGEVLIRQMNELSGKGVIFAACRNALLMHKLDEKMLPPFIRVVPAGITEIVKKQAGGYAYIKP